MICTEYKLLFGDFKLNKEGEPCDVYGGGTRMKMEYGNFGLKKGITRDLQTHRRVILK